MEKYLFWGTFFFAYLINGITGFAGNIFAMPVGMVTIGHEESIVVLNCTGFLASVLIAFTGIKHVVWKELAKMCVIMAIFMAIGAWINTIAPLSILSKVYGVAVLIIAIRGLFFNKKNKLLPDWLLYCILAIAGLIQGMFVSGGSFLAIYALQKIRDKEAFRATTTMTWVFLNGALCPLWHSGRLPWWRWLAYAGSVHPPAYSFHLAGRSYPEAHQPRAVREVHLRPAYRNWLCAFD